MKISFNAWEQKTGDFGNSDVAYNFPQPWIFSKEQHWKRIVLPSYSRLRIVTCVFNGVKNREKSSAHSLVLDLAQTGILSRQEAFYVYNLKRAPSFRMSTVKTKREGEGSKKDFHGRFCRFTSLLTWCFGIIVFAITRTWNYPTSRSFLSCKVLNMYEVVCATGISRSRRQQLMLKPLPETNALLAG